MFDKALVREEMVLSRTSGELFVSIASLSVHVEEVKNNPAFCLKVFKSS